MQRVAPTSRVAAFMCAGLSGAAGITIPLENEEEKERRDRTARMQAGKNAMASVKETAGNVAASAKAGMDKTTATVQEKVEKMTAHTPTEKAMAEERKQEKVREAEINKQETMQQNAAAQQRTLAAHDGGRVAEPGVYPVGGAPGEVAGHPTGGHLISGAVRSRPIGRDTGTARPDAAHNPYVGSTEPAARGTGGRYA